MIVRGVGHEIVREVAEVGQENVEGQDQEKGNQKTVEVMHHKRNMTMFRSRRRNLTQDTTNTRIKRMEVEVGEVFRGI